MVGHQAISSSPIKWMALGSQGRGHTWLGVSPKRHMIPGKWNNCSNDNFYPLWEGRLFWNGCLPLGLIWNLTNTSGVCQISKQLPTIADIKQIFMGGRHHVLVTPVCDESNWTLGLKPLGRKMEGHSLTSSCVGPISSYCSVCLVLWQNRKIYWKKFYIPIWIAETCISYDDDTVGWSKSKNATAYRMGEMVNHSRGSLWSGRKSCKDTQDGVVLFGLKSAWGIEDGHVFGRKNCFGDFVLNRKEVLTWSRYEEKINTFYFNHILFIFTTLQLLLVMVGQSAWAPF